MMRYAAAAMALLIGCASGPSDHKLRISVYELVSQRQVVQSTGTHLFRLRIGNDSHETVVIVHSIRLQPAGLHLYSDDPSQRFERQVDPGETEIFDMYLTVQSDNPLATSPLDTSVMDSMQVMIGCTANGQDFIESGTYMIAREMSGR